MKDRFIQALVIIPLVILALCPPVKWSIPIVANSTLWLWLVLICGFLGFLFLYAKANAILRILVVYILINAIASKAPYLSLTSYILFIPAVYYYYVCTKVKDWSNIFKVFQALFLFTVFLIVLQLLGIDHLCNLGQDKVVYWGFTGNQMWLSSLLVCMAPFLLIKNKLNAIPILIMLIIMKSSGGLLSLFAGIVFYSILNSRKKKRVIIIFLLLLIPLSAFIWKDSLKTQLAYGRWPVWERTVELTMKRPALGWGIGTYKVIIPSMTKDVAGGLTNPWEYEGTKGDWIRWMQAHNCWLQVLFETGFIGFILFCLFIGSIFFGIFFNYNKNIILAASGAVMIFSNMLIHYPTRMNQTVLILICFLAYLEQVNKGEIWK